MKFNLAELKRRYYEMIDEVFARVNRENLLPTARLYCDGEARRRDFPKPRKGSRPDAQQILLEVRRRRVKGAVVMVVVLLAGQPLFLLDYRLSGGFFGPFLVIPSVLALAVFATTFQRGDKLVLWLRRFHMRRPGGTHFENLLEGACAGFGYALTVQDSTFKRSLSMSLIKGAMLLGPLMLVSLVGAYMMCTGFLSVFGLAFSDPQFILLVLGVGVLLGAPVAIFGSRRLGYVFLKPANAREKTLRVIRKIEKRRGWQLDIGVFVIHCGDSFWREIVQLCLTCASVTVIDVTELSENVIWELETAFRLMAPESIVLACAVGEGAPKELPDQVREQLLTHLPVRGFTRVQTFFYPLHSKQLTRYPWGNRRALRAELKGRLAFGMAQSSSAPGDEGGPV